VVLGEPGGLGELGAGAADALLTQVRGKVLAGQARTVVTVPVVGSGRVHDLDVRARELEHETATVAT
jgi:hypothetical protein